MEFKYTQLQGELFIANMVSPPIKDDLASMDFPIFSLAKQRDMREREYRLGAKVIRIIPSGYGAATVFDKDLLLYIQSQIISAINLNQPVSRTVYIKTIDFLHATDRGDGRASFERIMDMLRRLKGTIIETNIATNGKIPMTGFTMLDRYEIAPEDEKKRIAIRKNSITKLNEEYEVSRVSAFTVTINDWVFNSLIGKEVLTLNSQYYQMSSATERRIYEIARKYSGDKPIFKIGIDKFSEKLGTTKERFKIRDQLRELIALDSLPGFHMALDTNATPDWVIFYTRAVPAFNSELIRTASWDWYQTWERHDNKDKWQSKSKAMSRKLPANEDAD